MMTPKFRYSLFVCGATAAILCFSVILVKYVLGIEIVPAIAYYLLAIPPAWFYFRTEYNCLKQRVYESSRDAAMVLLAVFLAFYLFPYLFQFLMFPEYSPGFAHYHYYALPALIAALLLIRLHAYGGSTFCVFAGTAAGFIAFFFILTAIPVLSPIYYPINTAFAALSLSFFLFITARDDGLIKDALAKFANITDTLWGSLKSFFVVFLLIACLLLVAFSIFQPVKHQLTGAQLADLLIGNTPRSPLEGGIEGGWPSRGDFSETMLPQSNFFIGIALIVFVVVSAFFYFERTLGQEQYHRLSPVLWLALALLLVYSACLSYVVYTDIDQFAKLKFSTPVLRLDVQIIIWALVSFIAGRFLNLSPLWLWGIFLLYPFMLPSIAGQTRTFVAFHPFTLACVAIGLSGLSVVTARVKGLYEHTYPWPWAQQRFLMPSFLFSAASQVIVYLVFSQAAADISYRHKWLTVIGMFLAALPAVISAYSLGTSRHFLFYLPYMFACIGLMLALQTHFPENGWLVHLKNEHLINCALLVTLITAVISEYFSPCKEKIYRSLKDIAAMGIVILTVFVYLDFRNIDDIGWQRFLTSGIVTLGAGLYFMHLIHEKEDLRKAAKTQRSE